MSDDSSHILRPIRWQKLRADEAERLIHERARETAIVLIVGHPAERAAERLIDSLDVYRILRGGQVIDQPRCNAQGDWEAIIAMPMRGRREAAAVTIVLRQTDGLIVKTVMWLDA